ISSAGIISLTTIKYVLPSKARIDSLDKVKVMSGTEEIEVTALSSLNKELVSGVITVAEELDLSKNYTVCIEGFEPKNAFPTEVFDSAEFIAKYTYDGDDLGAVINGDNTTFKVWAPTASKVVLNLFEAGNGGSAYKSVDMVKGEGGVWSYTEACGHGTYYTYTVTTSVGTQEAVDPYAKAAGVNGNRGMVVDLSLTNPTGWDTDTYRTDIDSYSEAIIWEVHVRDFSNKISTSQYKGKYLAFTEDGLVNEHGQPVGLDYLVELGITHVHLLPVYDYASVDETSSTQFNWGYDPKNYNVPEGSYSTDPYNGEVRIAEFKEMVQALHNAGIGVIMDVVYNHTYEVNSNLNKVVPYYYYRYNEKGANTSASGCGNDTASERYMYGKYMVDSTSYWMEEYHLDGFRFDLMGLHDLDTMQEVESAVHTINPNAIIYGEGWSMTTIPGETVADQKNISKITPTGDAIGGIAVFNDTIRDALKGSVFDTASQGYINGNATATNLRKILFSMNGGNDKYFGQSDAWVVKDSMVINYMSAHDNNTLWDKLILSVPNATDDERNQMNNLGAAIVMLSKGTPFWQAGEEMLRTKPDGNGGFDHNSYKSSDEVNNIDWSVLDGESMQYNTMLYYKGLIEMRKAFGVFSDNDTVMKYTELSNGAVAVRYGYLDENQEFVAQALVIINPAETSLNYYLDAEWNLVATSEQAGATAIAKESGVVTVDSIGIRVYVNDALLGE
ncbi:MAG: type I pullulanase, partial [Clostridia bacterium]|nr:type I pullulanase [Clostridia bacterium]